MDSIAKAVQKARGMAQLIPPSPGLWTSGNRAAPAVRRLDPDDIRGAHEQTSAEPTILLSEAALRAGLIVAFDANAAPSRHYDLLRDQIVHGHQSPGPMVIAVTAASSGCGATVTAANLAFTFARNPAYRVALIARDEEHHQSLRSYFGLTQQNWRTDAGKEGGAIVRVANVQLRLAPLGPDRDSSEALIGHAGATQNRQANVVFIDLPALPTSDIATSYIARSTDVVVVLAAGETTPAEVQSCKSVLGQRNGVHYVLNKSGRHGL
ncbi:hypothetical protein QBK99_06450 [Corticibacterium sp. UT-5YL-CI-8]|nr:hypothetical protein [Tianweitania sp. UT-5YL-CI-8]